MSDKYKLVEDGSVVHTWEDITDRLLKDRFGEDHGLEHVRKKGVFTWPKKKEDVYWKWFNPSRVPIYFEYFIDSGEQIDELWNKYGGKDFFDFDWTRFKALADWYPCPTHTEDNPEYDMNTFYWRAVMHCNSMTQQNPWLDECSQEDPNVYAVQMHVDTAKEKGIADGDKVWLENPQEGDFFQRPGGDGSGTHRSAHIQPGYLCSCENLQSGRLIDHESGSRNQVTNGDSNAAIRNGH
jgi:anaerobic selenocysteine-containing dehydrogenase